ncbi:MAG: DMT family transporter [Bacteroidota bacterium]
MPNVFTPGVRMMLLAALIFAVMQAFVKRVEDLHVLEIVFFRSIVTAAMCIAYLKAHGIPMLGKQRPLLVLRAVVGVISMTLFFYTIQRMPLGASVSLKYLSPVFAAVFAYPVLKERIRPIQWLFIAGAFAGVLLLRGFDARIDSFNLMLGLIGAVFGGLVYVLIRKIGKAEHPMVIINYFMVLSTVVTGIGMIPFWEMPAARDFTYLIVVGVLGYFGQVYMTKALQLELASRVTPVKYMEVIYSLIIGLIWFGEVYSLLSLTGILLIVISMLSNLIVKQRFVKKAAA